MGGRETARAELERHARELAFSLVGVTTPERSEHLDFYESWIASGYHGEMAYLAREDAVTRRADLKATMAEVRSCIVVAHEYGMEDRAADAQDPSRGVVARYARGRDYHRVVKRKLEELLRWLDADVEGGVRGRAYVDTGPILERDLARRAGLGWFGRNTMLIHPKKGSYFFLGLLLVDVDLPADTPFREDHCGTCRACLDACPTRALLGRNADGAPIIDARLCISYLTIELRGPIPRELRSAVGNRVFGCDVCQEVCPFTRKFSTPSPEPAYAPRAELDGPPLLELAERLLGMSDEDFGAAFAGTAVRRARRDGLLRNVCVALGNWGSEAAVPVLASALSDSSALVRSHAAWALGRIGSTEARDLVSARLELEEDPDVSGELASALEGRRR